MFVNQQSQQQTNGSASSSSSSTGNVVGTAVAGGDGTAAPSVTASVRYPLQDKWSFYFLKNDQSRNWKDNIVFIETVSTAEQFWSVVNHLQTVNKMHFNTDLMLFKQGIQPMWEDPSNVNGGRWVLFIDRRQSSVDLDAFWLHLTMAMVGNHFGDVEEGCLSGAVLSIRKGGCKISVWTNDAQNERLQRVIGKKIKQILSLPSTTTIFYELHGFAMSGNRILNLPIPLASNTAANPDQNNTTERRSNVPLAPTVSRDEKYRYKE